MKALKLLSLLKMRRPNDRTNAKVNTCHNYSWIAELIVTDKIKAVQSYQSVQWALWASGKKEQKFKFSWKYTEKKSLEHPLPPLWLQSFMDHWGVFSWSVRKSWMNFYPGYLLFFTPFGIDVHCQLHCALSLWIGQHLRSWLIHLTQWAFQEIVPVCCYFQMMEKHKIMREK